MAGIIAKWPAELKNKGEMSKQVAHISDIAPTYLAAAGLNPETFKTVGKGQTFEEINLLPYFKNTDLNSDRKLYWEHSGNRAARSDDWKLVASFKEEWKLYNVAKDETEMSDLAA